MNPTTPTNPAQRIDQTWSGGTLVEEIVHAWPEDGTAVRRWLDGDTVRTEQLTGLPIPVVVVDPADVADQLAAQAAGAVVADTRALADGLTALAAALRSS